MIHWRIHDAHLKVYSHDLTLKDVEFLVNM